MYLPPMPYQISLRYYNYKTSTEQQVIQNINAGLLNAQQIWFRKELHLIFLVTWGAVVFFFSVQFLDLLKPFTEEAFRFSW